MKLGKLPYLCQREIFKEMHFSTRYTFTFGTRRMKIWATRLQKTMKSTELRVEIDYNAADLVFKAKSGERLEKIMGLSRRWMNPEISKRVMKFSDLELECEVTFSQTLYLKYDNPLPPTVRILESLCEFFHTSKEDIVYYLNCLVYLDRLPPIPIRKSVVQMTSWQWNMNQMDQFFSFYPLQNFSMISAKTGLLNALPSKIRGFFNTKNLILTHLGSNFYDFLTNFRGENAVFRGKSIQKFDINHFLKSWLRKWFCDLKTIIVEVETPITQVEEVFAGIEHTKEKKGARYPYSSIIQEYYNFPQDAFDCTNSYSIARNPGHCSEKKATVKMTQNFFMFLVWD